MLRVTAATTNPGKIRELATLFGGRLRLSPAPPTHVPPAEEGESYLDNARLKARALFTATGGAALADDSGLEVDALGGRPGVHSARYGASPAERVERLLGELGGRRGRERSARFRTALVLVLGDGREIATEGTCEGEIADSPRGGAGFGYDPVFLVPALGRTFGELPIEEKNPLSARGAAAAALIAEIEKLEKLGLVS
jgi:XTP/dITP diphosphohydrolase